MKRFSGILAGTDQIINQTLLGVDDGTRSFGHKREALRLTQAPTRFDAANMLRLLVKQIRETLVNHDLRFVGNSRENWREDMNPDHSDGNDSNETLLERKLVQSLQSKVMDQAILTSWLGYTRDIIEEANPDHVIVVGKGVARVVEKQLATLIGENYTVIEQPNAHLSAERHLINFKTYQRLCLSSGNGAN